MTVPENTDARSNSSGSSTTWRAWSAAFVIVLVFSAVVVVFSFDLRSRLRAEVLRREGELLHAVALLQREVVDESLDEFGLAVDGALEVALQTSRMRGVLAVRIFDATGNFRDSVPVAVEEAALRRYDLAQMAAGRPVTRFYADFRLREVFLEVSETARAPMLEVIAPLPARNDQNKFVIVQYWVDGNPVAREFARFNQHIFRQAGIALLVGIALIGGTFSWGMRRLGRANTLLRLRAEDLARANRELGQAARTSAIGAITSHLMHGLRNPLAGLEGFVAAQSESPGSYDDGEWAAARESTRRLRSLINEVQTVLSDVDSGSDFEISAGEVCVGLRERLQPAAARHKVTLVCEGDADLMLTARTAGLGGFVLANLAQNAIEVTPEGGEVCVNSTRVDDYILFSISDHGPGLPEEVKADPFRPRRSSKPDGAGIGLAISRELARHAGGELELIRSDSSGVEFRVRLPMAESHASSGVS